MASESGVRMCPSSDTAAAAAVVAVVVGSELRDSRLRAGMSPVPPPPPLPC